MLHVYQTLLTKPSFHYIKKAGGNDFLRLLPIVCYWYLFENT